MPIQKRDRCPSTRPRVRRAGTSTPMVDGLSTAGTAPLPVIPLQPTPARRRPRRRRSHEAEIGIADPAASGKSRSTWRPPVFREVADGSRDPRSRTATDPLVEDVRARFAPGPSAHWDTWDDVGPAAAPPDEDAGTMDCARIRFVAALARWRAGRDSKDWGRSKSSERQCRIEAVPQVREWDLEKKDYFEL